MCVGESGIPHEGGVYSTSSTPGGEGERENNTNMIEGDSARLAT